QAFDSLIAKLIITGATRTEALQRARRALAEFQVEGMPTVLPFHRAVVDDPAFAGPEFTVHTRWIETEFTGQIPPYEPTVGEAGVETRETITVEVGGKRLAVTIPAGLQRSAGAGPSGPAGPAAGRPRRGGRRAGSAAAQADGNALVSPMQGTIVKIEATDGQQVSAGDTIVVLEAMKMEQPLTAHKDGTVSNLSVEVGQTVSAGAVICELGD
ncbi:MAG TPA: biotin/lipoyl-containing protein, partial [Streptosporangiaceae bacterium]|nr:biotin/lipoyl-containing protein [Streptosporangiaceae bacterium]